MRHLILAIALATLAGPAAAQPRPGRDVGACMQAAVASGPTFDVTGTVESAPLGGDAWTVKTADGKAYALNGFGPPWFWQKEGVKRPDVGDTLTVSGRVSDCCCGGVYVATSATVDGKTIRLRDETTGLPRWAGGPRTGTR